MMRHVKIADKFGIGMSTICDIKRDEARLRLFASMMDGMAISKKGIRVIRLASDDEQV